MSNLTKCIGKMGKLLSREDRDDLKVRYDLHLGNGVPEAEASNLAVSELMSDMIATRRSVLDQLSDDDLLPKKDRLLYALGGEPGPGSFGGDIIPPRNRQKRRIYDNYTKTAEARRSVERAGESEAAARKEALNDLRAGIPVSIDIETLGAIRTLVDEIDPIPGVRFGAVASIKPIDMETVEVGVIGNVNSNAVTSSIVMNRATLMQQNAFVSRDGKSVLIFRLNSSAQDGNHALNGQVGKAIIESGLIRGSFDAGLRSRLLGHAEKFHPLNVTLGRYAADRGEVMQPRFADMTLREYYQLQYGAEPDIDKILETKAISHLAENILSGRMADDVGMLVDVAKAAGMPIRSEHMDFAISDLASRNGAVPIDDIPPQMTVPHPRKPILAFHGTAAGEDFRTFDLSKSEDIGVHVGTVDQANDRLSIKDIDAPIRVKPVVLDVKNPITMNDMGQWQPNDLYESARRQGIEFSADEVKTIKGASPRGWFSSTTEEEIFKARDIIRHRLESAGYDSIRYLNQHEGLDANRSVETGILENPKWSYIVWQKGSIKSATDGDLMFAIGGRSDDGAKATSKRVLAAIRNAGGIKDETGDLAAMGVPRGIINPDGMSPDKMRELLVQDGFIDDVELIVGDGQATSQVDDLYELIREALNPNLKDGPDRAAQVDELVKAADDFMQQNMGTRLDLDDKEIKRLSRLVLGEGVSLEDALEQVAIESAQKRIPDKNEGLPPIPELRGSGEPAFDLGNQSSRSQDGADPLDDRLNQAKANWNENVRGPAEPRPYSEDKQYKKTKYTNKQHDQLRSVFDRLRQRVPRDDTFSPETSDKVWGKYQNSWIYRLYDQQKVKAKSNQFVDMLTEYFEGGQAKAAKELDRLSKTFDRATASPDEIKNYDDLVEFTSLHQDELVGIAWQVKDNILGIPGSRMMLELPLDLRGSLKSRTLNIPDHYVSKKVAKFVVFLERDIRAVTRSYLRSVIPQLLLTERFGSVDMKEPMAKMTENYNNLIAKAGDDNNLTLKLQDEKKWVLQAIHRQARQLQGLYGVPEDVTAMLPRTVNVMKQWNLVSMLGGMLISAFADPARIIMVQGLSSVMDNAVRPLAHGLEGMKARKAASDELAEMGAGLEAVMPRFMGMADINDDFGRLSPFERGSSWMAEKFGSISGMNQWNTFFKRFAGTIIMSRMLRSIRKVANGEQVPAKELERLRWNGLYRQDIEVIADQFSRHGSTDGGLFVSNTKAWGTEPNAKYSEKDIEIARQAFKSAVVREVDITIVTPGMDRPPWMTTWQGMFFAQFQSFNFASMNRTLLLGLQQRDAGVALGLTMAVGLGMGVAFIKAMINDKPLPKDVPEWLREGVDRSGFFGWLMQANHLLERGTGGAVGLEALGFGKETSRYASRNTVGSFFGPSMGKLTDILSATSGISRSIAPWKDGPNDQLRESDLAALRRIIPLQNVFYLSYLFQKAEQGLRDSLDVPTTGKRRTFDLGQFSESMQLSSEAKLGAGDIAATQPDMSDEAAMQQFAGSVTSTGERLGEPKTETAQAPVKETPGKGGPSSLNRVAKTTRAKSKGKAKSKRGGLNRIPTVA